MSVLEHHGVPAKPNFLREYRDAMPVERAAALEAMRASYQRQATTAFSNMSPSDREELNWDKILHCTDIPDDVRARRFYARAKLLEASLSMTAQERGEVDYDKVSLDQGKTAPQIAILLEGRRRMLKAAASMTA